MGHVTFVTIIDVQKILKKTNKYETYITLMLKFVFPSSQKKKNYSKIFQLFLEERMHLTRKMFLQINDYC